MVYQVWDRNARLSVMNKEGSKNQDSVNQGEVLWGFMPLWCLFMTNPLIPGVSGLPVHENTSLSICLSKSMLFPD